MKVLVVEDNEDNRNLLMKQLRAYGHEVTATANGTEALEQALVQPPDIIVSDILMPEMDGYQLCQECKQNDKLKNIPFVFYTATYTLDEDKKFALSLGASAFILKPTEPDILVRMLSEVFEKAKTGALAPPEVAPLEPSLFLTEYNKRIVAKLDKKVAQLEMEITERKQMEHDIGKRLKELQCLYSISQISERVEFNLNEACQEVANLLPSSWQYPEITCARITFGDKEFKTDNFKTSERKQSADINIKGNKEGTVEVYYLEERPESAEGPFLMEERNLIDGIARILSDMFERRQLEAQLLQSQKMEAVGVLAGGVAHDFNNLLTVILGYSDIVLDALGDNEPLRKDIEEIKNAGKRAASLTRQLLTFSRQEVLQPKILNLNALATNIEKMLRRLIGEDIELVIILEPKVKSIKADPGQIEQVIMNLVVNAKDAMPEGGKIIIRTENVTVEEEYCRFYPDARTGEFVSLLVEDTGTGIDKEVIRHIFEPFFTTKERGKGTGLGLSVVYGIAKQHGGWINVYSEPGQGATFRIYLPVVLAEATEQTEEAVSIDQLKGHGERILIVEDEDVIRGFATRALGENGYVLFEATNAREALDIFEREQGKFHLVLSDVVLPDKNGLELAKQLLSLKPQLPILMTSGYTDQKAHWPLIQERGFRFLHKPYAIIGLLQAVKKAIEQAK